MFKTLVLMTVAATMMVSCQQTQTQQQDIVVLPVKK